MLSLVWRPFSPAILWSFLGWLLSFRELHSSWTRAGKSRGPFWRPFFRRSKPRQQHHQQASTKSCTRRSLFMGTACAHAQRAPDSRFRQRITMFQPPLASGLSCSWWMRCAWTPGGALWPRGCVNLAPSIDQLPAHHGGVQEDQSMPGLLWCHQRQTNRPTDASASQHGACASPRNASEDAAYTRSSIGLNSRGEFETTQLKEYPPAFCKGLASALVDSICSQPSEATHSGPEMDMEFLDRCISMVRTEFGHAMGLDTKYRATRICHCIGRDCKVTLCPRKKRLYSSFNTFATSLEYFQHISTMSPGPKKVEIPEPVAPDWPWPSAMASVGKSKNFLFLYKLSGFLVKPTKIQCCCFCD